MHLSTNMNNCCTSHFKPPTNTFWLVFPLSIAVDEVVDRLDRFKRCAFDFFSESSELPQCDVRSPCRDAAFHMKAMGSWEKVPLFTWHASSFF